MIPLPWTCLHGRWTAGAEDAHGNTVPSWADGVETPCFWWHGTASTEPLGPPTGSDQVTVEMTLVVDAALAVDHRDRFTVNGHDFEVAGLPKDYNHGPFGFDTRLQPIELRWIG